LFLESAGLVRLGAAALLAGVAVGAVDNVFVVAPGIPRRVAPDRAA
jgi:hypothetical protein